MRFGEKTLQFVAEIFLAYPVSVRALPQLDGQDIMTGWPVESSFFSESIMSFLPAGTFAWGEPYLMTCPLERNGLVHRGGLTGAMPMKRKRFPAGRSSS